jgi:hypothetical protein
MASRRVKPKSTPRILHLNLMRPWFDEIAAGIKRKEFRDYTPYWRTRLVDREYDFIEFRNGYATNAPRMRVQMRGVTVRGRGRGKQFVIKLGRILMLPTRKRQR